MATTNPGNVKHLDEADLHVLLYNVFAALGSAAASASSAEEKEEEEISKAASNRMGP